MGAIIDLILGTAGHIDHGKTALVEALTGTNTDRLPEEQRRGITIELGFARLDLNDVRLGIVDVPGHERFVRSMLAGASGIDLAMLVVAADDSVKPQTREHLDILRFMNLQHGVIALTKCDLADPDWVELVDAEVRELVTDTLLARAPIIRTSAKSGEGIEALRTALAAAASEVAVHLQASRQEMPFRMAIDRVFTMAGHGTVVTGSVLSGQASVGDMLRIEPTGKDVRVRSLQRFGDAAEHVSRGQRAAINLAGVHHDELQRGDEVASPGYLQPSRCLTVRLDLLEHAPRSLKHRDRLKLHLGTAECTANVLLLSSDNGPRQLTPAASTLAQLIVDQDVVAVWGQPFAVRWPSPANTIGGGRILDPQATRIRSKDVATALPFLRGLQGESPRDRAAAAIRLRRLERWRVNDLHRLAGVENPTGVIDDLTQAGEVVRVPVSASDVRYVHADSLDELAGRITRRLARMHQAEPLKRMLDLKKVMSPWLELPDGPALFSAAIDRLQRQEQVQRRDQAIALAGHGPQLSTGEQQLYARLIETIQSAAIEPPDVAQLQKQAESNKASVVQLLQLAVAEGELVQVSDAMFFHAISIDGIKHSLATPLAEGGMTLSEIRQHLGTSRKYALPLCEYLDAIGFTRRDGDKRYLSRGM